MIKKRTTAVERSALFTCSQRIVHRNHAIQHVYAPPVDGGLASLTRSRSDFGMWIQRLHVFHFTMILSILVPAILMQNPTPPVFADRWVSGESQTVNSTYRKSVHGVGEG